MDNQRSSKWKALLQTTEDKAKHRPQLQTSKVAVSRIQDTLIVNEDSRSCPIKQIPPKPPSYTHRIEFSQRNRMLLISISPSWELLMQVEYDRTNCRHQLTIQEFAGTICE